VELYSSILEKFGYDPLPFYQESPETPVSSPELAKDFPLILISGGRHIVYFHGANKHIDWLREIVPDPALQIHPKTVYRLIAARQIPFIRKAGVGVVGVRMASHSAQA
jgi:anaerobic selenocysteine-containing dehydrogenase